MENPGINLEVINSGLSSVKALRSTVLEVFKFLGDGPTTTFVDEDRDKFINELEGLLTNVTVCMSDLEKTCTSLSSTCQPHLGNSGLLSLDPAYEKTPAYIELIKTHRWFDKVAEISNQATNLFSRNSIKRTLYSSIIPSTQRHMPPTVVNVPQQVIDNTTANLMRLFPDLQVHITKPFGASTVIIVTVARTLKALITLRGLVIDWVIVKGFSEEFNTENNKVDMWSGSRYLVFQKITEHANAAMLHFYSPILPELAIKSFLMWLRSYNTLFTVPCCKCGNRLHGNMPPSWRDFRNLRAYHEFCKP